MRLAPSVRSILGIAVLLFANQSTADAGRPLVADTPLPHRNFPTEEELQAFLEPCPARPFPDDPPPHEGAMFDDRYIIEPPDLIIVEVLEALPGRPISGERLVRPDGTINLGFYGDVYVRGLTVEQAKVKILMRLRRYIADDTLGLFKVIGESGEAPEEAPPTQPDPMTLPPSPPGSAPFRPEPPDRPSRDDERPPRGAFRQGRRQVPSVRLVGGPAASKVKPLTAPRAELEQNKAARGESPRSDKVNAPAGPVIESPLERPPSLGAAAMIMAIHPADSDRVFVDIANYNSKAYYVQGDVATPGRMPWTGNETILDALNYAGGLLHTADPGKIRLARPARGEKPARVFRVDLAAITEKGDASQNLQMLPGDRIFVGRNAVVQSTIEMDRIASSLQSPMNSMLSSTLLMRSLTQTAAGGMTSGAPISVRIKLGDLTWVFDVGARAPDLTDAQREAILKGWADFWWKAASKSGTTLDEKSFREALMRSMVPPASPPPAEKK